jgi:demethylmenaquinone methyltransferase/2-methoxy-6-polyprenyl-1,4-benzoquinol methylase
VFDGVMTAFVLRNVSDLSIFFGDAFRVIKNGGKLVSLDMFPPSATLFAQMYGLYFYQIVPWIGGILAGDRSAYGYLSQSVRDFHAPEAVSELIHNAGFTRVTLKKYLDGAVCLHVAEKNGTFSRS